MCRTAKGSREQKNPAWGALLFLNAQAHPPRAHCIHPLNPKPFLCRCVFKSAVERRRPHGSKDHGTRIVFSSRL